MKTPTTMQRSSTWSCGMTPSRTESTTARATPACAGPNICTAWVAPLIVTLLAMSVSGLAGRFGATTARRLVCPSFWLRSAVAKAWPTGPSLRPMRRSMWATSLPSPTRDSPTIREPAIRAFPPVVVSTLHATPGDGRDDPSCAARRSYTMARMAVKQARPRRSEPAARAGRTAEAVAGAAQLACVLEVGADKPGNITPRHDFADTSYEDMVASAVAIGPELGRAAERGVGATVLAAVHATGRVAGANTNLGIALLLAPLARAALAGAGVGDVLGALTVEDARDAYEAIRRAGAGGLDEPVEHDVREAPAIGLSEAMAAAAERDSVAREYATGFATTFDRGLPALDRALEAGLRPRVAIVELFLELLAAAPDTLIARKRGRAEAERVSAAAAAVLQTGGVRTGTGRDAVAGLDAALRRDGNALNPGTTADLVTAVLFVAVLEGRL